MENPKELAAILVAATKLPDAVIARQLERTGLTYGPVGKEQRDSILAAGLALQEAGVLGPEVKVEAQVDALLDSRFLTASR